MKITAINSLSTKYNTQQGIVNKKFEHQQRPQIDSVLNAYYKPLSFKRAWSEHKSWGAVIDPVTKEASFKLFTYPDAENVIVTVEKRNNKNNQKCYTLKNMGNGVFETEKKIPKGEVSHGDKYEYTIHRADGSVETVKDPYTFRQEEILGKSTVYDHSLYKWNDSDWFKNNKHRISRNANKKNGLKNVDSARIFEFNTSTLTKRGNFESAMSAIKTLPQLGFNAIEIMPVENTFSFNWGYDGVDKLAPAEHLGGPDALKALVDCAHENGLNVIMDMVPNHLGPDGAALARTGPYIKGSNCFGDSFRFEGENSRYVRDYMVNAALNWIDNYHCDGLRLDMTKFMDSDFALKQMVAEINYHRPDAFVIAEDGRSSVSVDGHGNYWDNHEEPHDKRVTSPLHSQEYGAQKDESVHCEAIEKISTNNSSLARLGCDSEWDFNYYHTLNDGLYGVINLCAFEKACYCSQDNVKYIMSHDEIGNFEGTRLLAKLMVPMLHLNDNVVLDDNDMKRIEDYKSLKKCSEDEAKRIVSLQKAQLTAEKLAILLQTGELDKYNTDKITNKRWLQNIEQGFIDEVLVPNGLRPNSGITYNSLNMVFTRSIDKNKMALARTYAIPGPKMVFQGDERADLTPFRFFRQFDSVKNETYLTTEKGYKSGKPALIESQLGRIQYSTKAKTMMSKFKNLTKDLNKINEENPALSQGYLLTDSTVKHDASQVFASHAIDNESGNEIFAITNFSDSDYPRYNAAEYYIEFPKGEWVEILNTDDKKYGGSGNFMNTNKLLSIHKDNLPIKLAGESTVLFKRIK